MIDYLPTSKWILAICVLLAGCTRPVEQPQFDASTSDAPLLCERFGGLKSFGYERAVSERGTRMTIRAECNDGSSVWRWTERKL